MIAVRQSPLDGYFVRGALDGTPWTIHAEVVSARRFDQPRLAAAVAAALRLHPMARANAPCWESGWWYIDEAPPSPETAAIPVTWTAASTEAGVDDARDRYISQEFAPGEAPLVRFGVIRAPLYDHLLSVTHHAVVDGIGTLLLMKAVLDAYAYGPVAEADSSWEGLRALAIRPSTARPAALVELRTRVRDRCAAVAADGGSPGERGWGFVQAQADDASPTASAVSANDTLLAAFHLALGRWNAEHGEKATTVGVALTVNLRPHHGWYVGAANASLAWPTRTSAAERQGSGRVLIDTVARQVRACRFGISGSAVATVVEDLVRRDGHALWLRQALAETTVVSNMGDLGRALDNNPLPIVKMAGSMPATTAMSVSFYVGRWGDQLTVGARFRRSALSRSATGHLLHTVLAAYHELGEQCHD